ncbi:hypothetical protein HK096_008122, partial [Nowakowskiella sp. JEL0078]
LPFYKKSEKFIVNSISSSLRIPYSSFVKLFFEVTRDCSEQEKFKIIVQHIPHILFTTSIFPLSSPIYAQTTLRLLHDPSSCKSFNFKTSVDIMATLSALALHNPTHWLTYFVFVAFVILSFQLAYDIPKCQLSQDSVTSTKNLSSSSQRALHSFPASVKRVFFLEQHDHLVRRWFYWVIIAPIIVTGIFKSGLRAWLDFGRLYITVATIFAFHWLIVGLRVISVWFCKKLGLRMQWWVGGIAVIGTALFASITDGPAGVMCVAEWIWIFGLTVECEIRESIDYQLKMSEFWVKIRGIVDNFVVLVGIIAVAQLPSVFVWARGIWFREFYFGNMDVLGAAKSWEWDCAFWLWIAIGLVAHKIQIKKNDFNKQNSRIGMWLVLGISYFVLAFEFGERLELLALALVA